MNKPSTSPDGKRLDRKRRDEDIETMNNLKLPDSKMMDIAIPT